MIARRAALLLDLDGVLVHEVSSRSSKKEVILLHDDVDQKLRRLPHEVFVLTHRSRAESHELLRALRLADGAISRCYAAEDIAYAGAASRPLHLLRSGLRKSLVLPAIARASGLGTNRLCLVDDRLENIEDTLRAGVGLGILAPFSLAPGPTIDSFRFSDMIQAFLMWADRDAANTEPGGQVLRLSRETRRDEHHERTAVTFSARPIQPFPLVRRLGHALRRRSPAHGRFS